MILVTPVSTIDQALDLQNEALLKAGCEKVFSGTASGSKVDRKGLAKALDHLREEMPVVWRLDQLGRFKQLIELTNNLLIEE